MRETFMLYTQIERHFGQQKRCLFFWGRTFLPKFESQTFLVQIWWGGESCSPPKLNVLLILSMDFLGKFDQFQEKLYDLTKQRLFSSVVQSHNSQEVL